MDRIIAASTTCCTCRGEQRAPGRPRTAAPGRTRRRAPSASPVRIAVPGSLPNKRDSAMMSADLHTSSATSRAAPRSSGGATCDEIQLHADGDEEQPQQHVLERPDVLLHLVAVLGLRDQHPGQERAQRQRQIELAREPGEPEREQQQVEHEQLGRLAPRHQMEPGTHQPLAEKQDQRQARLAALASATPRLSASCRCAGAERGNQDQERHHGQVLEQQHPDDLAAVLGVELQAVGQHLAQYRGRGHGQRARRAPAPPCQPNPQRTNAITSTSRVAAVTWPPPGRTRCGAW